ncbi:PREDICTED: grpE protein homolog 1, mitochondrial isoform X1 [Myotis davidii]|uniref:grpE protein homolog 1, mitochondrial isoform X1 n=1 Tax=Myotis davidii TaxID=225400 RepID=UPI0003EC279B|nr:PREDICTED: grpE protein homolog 1, mitochondrial isoform X1 [Myotis davidii]
MQEKPFLPQQVNTNSLQSPQIDVIPLPCVHFPRPTPRLLCTAAKQKNSGQNLEEDAGQTDQKTDTPCAEKTLMEEKAKLEEQLKDTVEKYKRALADTENLRQRTQKLVEEAKLYGIQGFCKDLLEVADILEKATQCVPKEEITEDNPHLKNLYEGLVMTEVQIQKVFTKHGLLRLDPVGAKFDPYEHEALFHAPVEGKEPGTVALAGVGLACSGWTCLPKDRDGTTHPGPTAGKPAEAGLSP